jgi:threonine/homoserine efflux transporter RhtA
MCQIGTRNPRQFILLSAEYKEFVMRNVINTRVHGMLDYLVGVLLIAAPWILQFDDDRNATLPPVILGAGIILYSLLTDYEYGAVHLIPMSLHLALDAIGGIALALTPWVFDFSDDIWWPHVAVGVLELIVVALTQTRRSDESRAAGSPQTPPIART